LRAVRHDPSGVSDGLALAPVRMAARQGARGTNALILSYELIARWNRRQTAARARDRPVPAPDAILPPSLARLNAKLFTRDKRRSDERSAHADLPAPRSISSLNPRGHGSIPPLEDIMAKTKRKLKGTSRGRKATRVARKPQKVSWLAKGYPVLSSVTVLDDCPRAIEWYRNVLGAKQRLRLDMPGGTVAHCELGFGDAVLMMGSPMPPQFPQRKASLAIYVKNCDTTYNEALSAGARSLQEPTDQFYGDRNARFEDPFGNEWSVMTHVKDVSEREMKKTMAQMGNAG
jgi:PhnB protein